MKRTMILILVTLLMVGMIAPVALADNFSVSEMQDNALGFIAFIVIIAAAIIAIKQFVAGQVVQAIIAIIAGAIVFVLLNVQVLQGLGESLLNFLTGGN